MKVSPAGVELVKGFEGFVGHAYRDAVGVLTIGYGHTAGVREGETISEKQASALLRQDLDKHYAPAVNALKLPLSQHQFDALVSFVYNVGPGGVAAGTQVGAALRRHDWKGAADHLLDWDRAGGRVLAGLLRRRQAERALFLKVDDPLAGYRDDEKTWIREYDRLRRARRDPKRRDALRALMTRRRKQIWKAAQSKGGWDAWHRAARYHSLLARTT